MNTTKHTPGPWRLEADLCHFDSLTTITGGKRMNAKPHAWPTYPLTVQVGGMASVKEAQANASRIVACVNACEGFSIEELEGANLFKDSIESQDLIEGLLEALEQCRLALEPYDDVKPRDWKTDREKVGICSPSSPSRHYKSNWY